jgi:hypothetical protein
VIAASASSSRWGGRFNAETLIDDMRTAVPEQGREVPRAGRVLAVADDVDVDDEVLAAAVTGVVAG